jgi:HEAT repeat protein
MLGAQPIGGIPVSDDFTALPLAQGIVRLLRRAVQSPSYTLITDNNTGALLAVYILDSASGTSPAAVAGRLSPPGAAAREYSAARPGSITSSTEATHVDQATQSPEAQAIALRALRDVQDPRTLQTLQSALQSEVTDVRKAALEALRGGIGQETEVLAEVRTVAAHDVEPAVRQAALEVLVRYDESAATHALLEALAAEEEGASRDFARRELQRLEEEEEAHSRPDPQIQP